MIQNELRSRAAIDEVDRGHEAVGEHDQIHDEAAFTGDAGADRDVRPTGKIVSFEFERAAQAHERVASQVS